MRLYSYIVARDYGFAPNPFHGYCTLATCKPKIRAGAKVDDWVIGTGAKKQYNLSGRLIFAMRISEILTFDAYWKDPRFLAKRPVLNGSLTMMYGDNIYHHSDAGEWLQADSHHSLNGGVPNPANIERDTSVDRLLVADRFAYWGAAAPIIPSQFRDLPNDKDICCKARGHRVFSREESATFLQWLEENDEWGVLGDPLEFSRHARTKDAGGTL